MTDRETLIETMARAICNDCGIDWDIAFQDGWSGNARAALDAAEAAGWRLVPPEDGR